MPKSLLIGILFAVFAASPFVDASRALLGNAKGHSHSHGNSNSNTTQGSVQRNTLRDPSSNLYDQFQDATDGYPSSQSPSTMSSASPPPPSPPSPGFVGLSGDTLRRAESLTNVFEFSSVNPQYGYAENLGDGRGITFGRAGFCTGTGDGLVVVEEYTKREPNNPLASYLPALQAIEASRQGESNGDVTGLDGFVAAVKSAASDQTFKDVQDWVLNVSYLVPSQKAAQFLGAKYPLTQAQLYDAYFMHGQNDPTDAFYPYSANGMADWTDKALNGTPATGVNETVWLTTFLQHRKDVLTSNGQVWADATNRVDLYSYLVTAGAFQLDKTIVLQGGSCGASGVCSNSSSSVTVGPSVYGSFTIP